MENIKKKIDTKRIEEIKLEETFLEELVEKFNRDKKEYIKKKEEEDQTIKKSNELIEKLKAPINSNINEKIEKIEQNIDRNISKINEIKKIKEDDNNNIKQELENLKKELNTLELDNKEYHNVLNIKEKKLITYKTRLNEIFFEVKKVDNLIKNIIKRETEIKKKINDKSLDAVIDRHSIIQESIINLKLKKDFLKTKDKLEKTLKEKIEQHLKIKNQRIDKRLILENEYLNSLNGENAVELIKNRKSKFDEYDFETKKLIFISENNIKVIKNKIKMGNDFFNLKHQKRIKEKNEKNKEVYGVLCNLSNDRKTYERKLNELNTDIAFIKKTINLQDNEILDYSNTNESYFDENRKEIKDKEDRFKKEIIKNNETKLNETNDLLGLNKFHTQNIENLKKKYYEDKKKNEDRKNKIKQDIKINFNNKTKIDIEFIEREKEFKKSKKDIESRILYLKKKYNK
jgi:hypothetical protein